MNEENLLPYVREKRKEQRREWLRASAEIDDFLRMIYESEGCGPVEEPIHRRIRHMAFNRDESKEGGFKIIPKGTTVPVFIQSAKGKTEVAKSGRSEGKERDTYDLKMRVIGGEYHGTTIFDRVWLNIARNGDDVVIHGSHKQWCDLCDVLNINKDENGGYVMPRNAGEWAEANLTGKVINITVDEDEYEHKGKIRQTNRIDEILPVSKEQKVAIADSYKKLMAEIEMEAAEEAAKGGGTPDFEDDDDLPF